MPPAGGRGCRRARASNGSRRGCVSPAEYRPWRGSVAEVADTAAAAGTMHAGVVSGPGRASLESVPIPTPGPGEIRVRLEGSGVCGSNLPVWEGRPWFEYPLAPGAPGHEGWGIVDEVGPGV